MFSRLLGSAAVQTESVVEDLTRPLEHLFEPKKRTRTETTRELMTDDEILRINPRDGIALLQWSYPIYLRKVGWTELPQAKEIKQCGMLPVERMIPARDFRISKPEIEVEGKGRSVQLETPKVEQEELPVNDESAPPLKQSVTPW